MNSDIIIAHQNLIEAKVLFITFCTARVHELIESNKIVSNCHKQPSSLFSKKLLTVNEIVESIQTTYDEIFKVNPDIKVKEQKSFYYLNVLKIVRFLIKCNHLNLLPFFIFTFYRTRFIKFALFFLYIRFFLCFDFFYQYYPQFFPH